MNTFDRYRVNECSVGTVDISDRNIIFLSIYLDNGPRSTLQRLTVGISNNKTAVEEIGTEIVECINDNENDEVAPTILWDMVEAIMRGKLISRLANLKKTVQS